VTLSTRKLLLLAITIFLAGLISGRVSATQHQAEARQVPQVVLSPLTETPLDEVAGVDIARLPRFPDSIRTKYRRVVFDDVVFTELEYITDADVQTVRDYFRDIFRQHRWSVVDTSFSAGEWKFVVVNGKREAVIEIDLHTPQTEYELKLTEPMEVVELK
jgi:hypothetical protein